MVIADFQVEERGGKPRFFQETFLVADTQFEVYLRMFFLKISNADVSFGEGTLIWKLYTTIIFLPTTKQVQLVNPNKFVIVALDVDSETFVVHVAIWKYEEMTINPDRKTQIKAQSGVQSGG